MKNNKIINFVLLFFIVFTWCYKYNIKSISSSYVLDVPIQIEVNNNDLDIKSITQKIAAEYNQDWWLVYNVCYAESHFNSNAEHDGGAGKGICGIHKATFIGWEKEFKIDLDYNSNYDQIKMTTIAFSKGEKYRDDWSTYNRYITYGVFNKYEIK